MFFRVMENIFYCNLNNRNILREIMVKIGLERVDIQEDITMEALLDSGITELVMSLEFARKQEFKLKKIERLIYVRNIDGTFNKEESIVEVNIYYQGYKERMEINVIREQKWNIILGMLWLAYYNPEINWRIGEVKIIRCSEEYGKQWRPKQEKLGQEKQKKKEQKKKGKKWR